MDKLILVLYIDVANLDNKDVAQHVNLVASKLFTEEVVQATGAITFVIPVRTGGTRIECINPKYIIDDNLYESHHEKLDMINKNLDYYILLMKENGKQ